MRPPPLVSGNESEFISQRKLNPPGRESHVNTSKSAGVYILVECVEVGMVKKIVDVGAKREFVPRPYSHAFGERQRSEIDSRT